MRQINILGFKVAGVTALILLVLLGLYWGGKTLLAPDKEDAAAPEKNTAISLLDIMRQRDLSEPAPQGAATGLDLAQQDTYTRRYLASLPNDVPQEEILNQARLEAFVSDNKGILLPTVSVTASDAAGAEAIGSYLNAISSSHNNQIKTITSADIEAAFRLQVNSQDPKPLTDLSTMLKNNLAILQSVRPPQEAAALHTKLVAASIALSENTGLLLQMDQDFVGGLIGARKIEELGAVFQELATDVKTLEDKYGLK